MHLYDNFIGILAQFKNKRWFIMINIDNPNEIIFEYELDTLNYSFQNMI